MSNEEVFSTNTFAIASYLFMNGLHLESVTDIENRGFATFHFRPKNGENIKQMLLDFSNSESRKFDEANRTLKTLIRQQIKGDL